MLRYILKNVWDKLGIWAFLVSPRHLEKFLDLLLGWSHPILFSQLSNLCSMTLCTDKNIIGWFGYFSPASPALDLPALASPIQSLLQVLLSFYSCATPLLLLCSHLCLIFCVLLAYLISSSSFYLSNGTISRSGVPLQNLVMLVLSPFLSYSLSSSSHKSYSQVKPVLKAEIF